MKIHLMMTVICVLATQTTLSAEMYRCEMPDGRVLFGDKPVNLSDACQPVEEASPGEYVTRTPTAGRQPAAGAPLIIQAPRDREPAEMGPDAWEARAAALVDAYKKARKKRSYESYLVNKRKALAEMARLREEKALLMQDMANSPLNARQRERVRTLLDGIPD